MTTYRPVAIFLNSAAEISTWRLEPIETLCDSLGPEFPATGLQTGPHMVPTG